MLDYVVKLTREPWNIVQTDLQTLKIAGFSNVGILDIVQGYRLLCLRQSACWGTGS